MEILYTICDQPGENDYPKMLDQSLEGLKGQIPPDKIHITYTDPINEDHVIELEKQRYKVHLKNRPISSEHGFPSLISGKTFVGDLKSKDAIFIDCDTLINGNLLNLLKERKYQFAGRVGTGYYYIDAFDQQVWIENFERFGLTPFPMINTGFLIFRNYLHNKIKDDWLEFLRLYVKRKLSLPSGPHGAGQYALTLALRKQIKESDIWFLSSKEHAFGWENDPKNAYVYHEQTPC